MQWRGCSLLVLEPATMYDQWVWVIPQPHGKTRLTYTCEGWLNRSRHCPVLWEGAFTSQLLLLYMRRGVTGFAGAAVGVLYEHETRYFVITHTNECATPK